LISCGETTGAFYPNQKHSKYKTTHQDANIV